MMKQIVLVELNAESLMRKAFDLPKEIATILDKGGDEYTTLTDGLKKNGYADVAAYLDEPSETPTACIDIDYNNIKFHGYNPFSLAVEFLVPFTFDAEWLAKRI